MSGNIDENMNCYVCGEKSFDRCDPCGSQFATNIIIHSLTALPYTVRSVTGKELLKTNQANWLQLFSFGQLDGIYFLTYQYRLRTIHLKLFWG